jgi:hypothetical protein
LVLKKSILILALLLWSLLYVIGCGDGGNGQVAPTPTPVPLPTGPPPGCEGFVIDSECPAESLTELCSFWGYYCQLFEQNTEMPQPENFSIRPSDCVALDCFTLQCEEDTRVISMNIIEIETGVRTYPPPFSGTASINGDEFDFECPAPPVP